MNVAGFEEALDSALHIELEPDLVIAVASLPGLTVLKILAWADRNLVNNKDARTSTKSPVLSIPPDLLEAVG